MVEIFRINNITPSQLKSEKNATLKLLKELIPDALIIEVGSTAIKGVIGKQDIDILVRTTKKDFSTTRDILDKNFQRNTKQISNNEYQSYRVDSSIDIAIQLTIIDSQYDNFEQFLKILNTTPSLIKEYNDLKRKWNGMPMNEYRRAKSNFIETVLRKERG